MLYVDTWSNTRRKRTLAALRRARKFLGEGPGRWTTGSYRKLKGGESEIESCCLVGALEYGAGHTDGYSESNPGLVADQRAVVELDRVVAGVSLTGWNDHDATYKRVLNLLDRSIARLAEKTT